MKTAIRGKSQVIGIMILFIGTVIISGAGGVSTVGLCNNNGTTLYVGGSGPNNYTSIQDAIDNASDGDTVFVYDDSSPYNEHVLMDRAIQLIGENRNTTVIDGGVTNAVMDVAAESVVISRFTIRSAGGTGHMGINISSNNARISDIIISKYDSGINLISSCNVISNAAITECSRGIYLDGSSSNTISDSIISRNSAGIRLLLSDENNIISNDFFQNTDGIYFEGSKSNLIIYNNISDNSEGIWLNSGDGNTIRYNNIINNSIRIWNSCCTSIENNNFMGNSGHATFYFSFQESPFSRNRWSHNYWDGSTGIIPEFIIGRWGIFPWLNFDWRPARGPYEIVGNPIAIMNTSPGVMKLELYGDKMPITTENFIKLANDGFYDGLVFHRVIDNFMIQGGGFYPDGTHKESPYGTIILETDSDVQHVDGAISMARTGDPNSATSQFFICDGPQHFLDGQYAAFGKVIDGMDVVRAIASVDTTVKYRMADWPVDDVVIESITILSR